MLRRAMMLRLLAIRAPKQCPYPHIGDNRLTPFIWQEEVVENRAGPGGGNPGGRRIPNRAGTGHSWGICWLNGGGRGLQLTLQATFLHRPSW